MRKLILSITFLSILTSCTEELGGPTFTSSDDLEIRIDNSSSYTLENVAINTTGGSHNYGKVLQYSNSTYWPFQFAYPYFEVSFTVGKSVFHYQPKNYAGANKVDEGKYSALIYDIDTTKQTFTFRLEKEKD